MFRTIVEVLPLATPISLHDPIFFVGSCFAQTIGERFQQNKFDTDINPFGTLYNPASIFRLLHDAVNQSMPGDHTYLVNQGTHFNYQFHSDFSSNSRSNLQAQIEQALMSTREYLKSCQWMVITLGSAYGYELRENGQIVSNCHKMPAKTFHRRLLDPDEIVMRFEQLYRALAGINPNLKYILTVSPVRHVRDTLVQNSVSKSVLRVATHTIQQNHAHNVFYFPSYELMMDDLRDYRFYQSDMLHPSEVAEDYIWQKLTENYLTAETQDFLKKWKPLYQALQHRAFRPASEAHQHFLQKTISQLKQMSNTVDVQSEIEHLEKQLT
uniref:GSCFA domain-containing protein n=1 Tax=Roseihalotalea indica TaxID=2867963 RepID=A0AA49JFF3_9BACT|nr:GSCFA domain-containing protein [Tunicatimonas sp. TK19036]